MCWPKSNLSRKLLHPLENSASVDLGNIDSREINLSNAFPVFPASGDVSAFPMANESFNICPRDPATPHPIGAIRRLRMIN